MTLLPLGRHALPTVSRKTIFMTCVYRVFIERLLHLIVTALKMRGNREEWDGKTAGEGSPAVFLRLDSVKQERR